MSEAQPTGQAPAAPASTPPTATPAQPSQGFDWKSAGLSPESLEYVANKGFKDPGAVIGSYQNLEKMMGGRVKIPAADAPADEQQKFWGQLGRPEKPEGYGSLKDIQVPDGGLDIRPWFQGVAHKLNLPDSMAGGLAKEFVAYQTQLAQQEQEAYTAQVQASMDKVVKEWGPEAPVHQRNIQLFRQAFGLSVEQTTEMMLAVGPEAWAKFAAKAGGYFAEAKVGGDLPGGGTTFGMTKEAALAKLDELTADPAFAKRYVNEEAAAVNEITRLRRVAYGS